jgi:hypothetical protein
MRYIGGIGETRAVHQWAQGGRAPSDAIQQRLRMALRIAMPIAHGDSPAIAQASFQGLNLQLDDRAPARLLRDGDLDEAGPAIVAPNATSSSEVSPILRALSPAGALYRVGRSPDAWTLAPWTYAGSDGTFGNCYDDPAGSTACFTPRVSGAVRSSRGSRASGLICSSSPSWMRSSAMTAFPTIQRGVVPRDWWGHSAIGRAAATSLSFIDIVQSSLWRICASSCPARPLGDELENWAIFEGHDLDEVPALRSDARLSTGAAPAGQRRQVNELTATVRSARPKTAGLSVVTHRRSGALASSP